MGDKRPQFIDLIICDDIRQEVGNKYSLIGIYSDRIRVDEFPFRFPKFCIFQKWKGGVGKCIITTEIVDIKNDTKLLEAKIQIECKPKNIANIFLMSAGIKFENEGEYNINIFLNDQDQPTVIHNFNILKR